MYATTKGYKNPDTLRYPAFIEFLKLAEGGAFLYSIFLTFLYAKKYTLHYVLYKKCLKLCVKLLYAKKITLRYVIISKFYCIVLMPSYKRTYDQSDHIKK